MRELKDWASLWADLLLVEMALHAREGMVPNPPTVFARRALWEGAVVAYGRTIKGGSRQVIIRELIGELGADAQQVHDEVIRWRDKHIAHRVDREREAVSATVVIDPEVSGILGIDVRVAPMTGPEDEGCDLVPRFTAYVKALRDLVWQKHLPELETKVIEAEKPRIAELLAAAEDTPPASGGRFEINVNPSGRPR